MQARLRRKHRAFSEMVTALVGDLPKSRRKILESHIRTVSDVMEQSSGSYYGSTAQALAKARASIELLVGLIKGLFDPSPGGTILVPDASAIVWNHELAKWEFADIDVFTLVITSTLLGELDSFATSNKTERVREAAGSAVRQIREFMRRGDIHGEGVPLRGQNTIRMSAILVNQAPTKVLVEVPRLRSVTS